MFDTTDAALLAEMSAAQRAERMATARRILAAGRLCQLRTVQMDEIDRAQWCIDNWEALLGTGMVPAQTMRDLARRASLRPLTSPALLCTEPRYRPSAALADYIKCRDLFCRFPGCDRPAEVCDIDHTVAWQSGGPTHPSNLALLCRAHHLLKTFWSGEKGWSETQYADGTIVWTSPSQRTYTTKPGGTLFFPQLNTTTETLNIAPQQSDSAIGRTLMMPTRRRTRAEERSARISWERGLNEARWAADPPPF